VKTGKPKQSGKWLIPTSIVAALAASAAGLFIDAMGFLGNALEDPITAIEAAGYTNLIGKSLGATTYSYAFESQLGYLDHFLGTPNRPRTRENH
jgi:hypothetical protein